MSDARSHDGACLCGAVRIRIRLPIIECYHCHCSQCRRLHAAAFVTWVKAASDRLSLLQGEAALRSYDLTLERRLYCGNCGSTMYGRLIEPTKRDVVWVPRAVLEDGSTITPTFHKYFGSRAPWHEVHDDLPRFDENGSLEFP